MCRRNAAARSPGSLLQGQLRPQEQGQRPPTAAIWGTLLRPATQVTWLSPGETEAGCERHAVPSVSVETICSLLSPPALRCCQQSPRQARGCGEDLAGKGQDCGPLRWPERRRLQ